MCGKSHIRLGQYLLVKYMPDLPVHYRKAFLIGCIEPDRNPATYVKGSIRHQWLRGHNYHNAKRFMSRISRRLERKKRLKLFDYYTLGKLIHYTADSFTFVHNDVFSDTLSGHRKYEAKLQRHFINYLCTAPSIPVGNSHSIMDAITEYHKQYSIEDPAIDLDCRYALRACCCVLTVLLLDKIN